MLFDFEARADDQERLFRQEQQETEQGLAKNETPLGSDSNNEQESNNGDQSSEADNSVDQESNKGDQSSEADNSVGQKSNDNDQSSNESSKNNKRLIMIPLLASLVNLITQPIHNLVINHLKTITRLIMILLLASLVNLITQLILNLPYLMIFPTSIQSSRITLAETTK